MADTFTIEIEHATGEAIDLDAVREALLELDIRVRTTAAGNHILARVQLERARDSFEHALFLALHDDEEDDD